ncbi:MAG TPA: glutaredoxin family protein [Acidimicrobiia bacterium]|nr:glutaredoxin family protein [Acidimicrobiia bacterium]
MRVTLVTSPGCHYCGDAREVLERVAADLPLDVHEIDLASPDGAAAQQKWRAPYPPLVLLDGELFGYGRISERKLRKTLSVERGC